MPGARCARSLAWELEIPHERSHHGHTGLTRHSPRNGFTAYNVLSPVTGLFCHRRCVDRSTKLDASVGASGPHDFAVRVSIARLATPTRPSHPAPNVRGDCAYAPLSGAGRRKLVAVICPTAQAEYFYAKGWTGFRVRPLICPTGKSVAIIRAANLQRAPSPSWPGVVPAIHVLLVYPGNKNVDARDKPGMTSHGTAASPVVSPLR
jgi:hypothetical protein